MCRFIHDSSFDVTLRKQTSRLSHVFFYVHFYNPQTRAATAAVTRNRVSSQSGLGCTHTPAHAHVPMSAWARALALSDLFQLTDLLCFWLLHSASFRQSCRLHHRNKSTSTWRHFFYFLFDLSHLMSLAGVKGTAALFRWRIPHMRQLNVLHASRFTNATADHIQKQSRVNKSRLPKLLKERTVKLRF